MREEHQAELPGHCTFTWRFVRLQKRGDTALELVRLLLGEIYEAVAQVTVGQTELLLAIDFRRCDIGAQRVVGALVEVINQECLFLLQVVARAGADVYRRGK